MSLTGGGRLRRAADSRGAEFWGRATGLFAVVFLVYAGGAVLSWEAFGATVGPAFFPPAGVTVAALLLSRRSLWPVVVAAVLLAEFLVDIDYGDAPAEVIGYAVANAIEPVVGAALVRAWCGGFPDLRQRKDLMLFIAGACVAGPLVGAVIGGWNIAALHGVWFPAAVVHWFAGDAIGVLVAATPILLWRNQSYVIRARPWETAVILTAAAVVSVGAFWNQVPPSMLVLPMLAWAALRLDMIGAAMAGIVLAFVANFMTVSGRGLFTTMDMPAASKLALTQVSIAVNVLVAMLIAQESSARMKAVREHEAERRERRRLETLARVGQRFSSSLTPKEIGDALEDHVLRDAGGKALNLGLLSADGQTLEWVTMAGYPQAVLDEFLGGVSISERTVGTDAVCSGEPVIVRSAAEYARRYPAKVHWQQMSATQSVVGWPLSSGGSPIGVLLLAWGERQPFDAAQLAYVSALATLVSQALVRARIYVDEHARAAVLQSAVLPTTPADDLGLDLCVKYEPADVAQGLGGDWYDLMAIPDNRKYLAVGDVVGHGLPAVEDMAQLRSAGRAMAHQGLSPSQLLTELNGFTRHASLGKFATMAVVILDSEAGTLSYGSAGHPPCLLRRAVTGDVIRLSDAQGPVLGPLEGVDYPEATVRVMPGDILVMYTDGLVEDRGSDIEVGIAKAQRMIAGWDADMPLSQYCDELQETLAPRPRDDDVCVIAVRFADGIAATAAR
ncbi:MAG: SpoIIE family protein phosphatase [Mycobacterium sp.]